MTFAGAKTLPFGEKSRGKASELGFSAEFRLAQHEHSGASLRRTADGGCPYMLGEYAYNSHFSQSRREWGTPYA